MTRLGDFLHFGQLFKAFGNNAFLGNFSKGVKINHFLLNHFWATFRDIWRFFTGHTGGILETKNLLENPE